NPGFAKVDSPARRRCHCWLDCRRVMGLPFADYYALLGVHAGVDDEELRSAWRRLAARWHPDRAGLGATEKFQQLSAAYTVLSDPLTRMAYDRRRRVEVRGSASAPRADGGVPRADDSANAARAA